jgi:hypothetical protein
MTEQIDELWAWLAEEPTGEGIVGMSLSGEHFPAVTGKRELADVMRIGAAIARRKSGYPVRLVRFVRVEVVEEIK